MKRGDWRWFLSLSALLRRDAIPHSTFHILNSLVLIGLTSTSTLAGPPPHGGPTQLFATDVPGDNASANATGVAAIVDGHVIPMSQVVLQSLRDDRDIVIDQMIQNYVIDRDCKRRGLVVSEAEIDKGVAWFRKDNAPATVDEVLKAHHMTMAELRYAFRQKAERNLVVEDQVKPSRMVHCREIQIKFCRVGENQREAGTTRTEAQALTIVKQIQDQLKHGASFADLAAKHFELDTTTDKHGDIGVVVDNRMDLYPAVINTALTMKPGQISGPFPSQVISSLVLLQAVSTDSHHPKTEDALYKAAAEKCRNTQLQFLAPKYMVGLMRKSKLTFVQDSQLVDGKPLPTVAATVDGHPILMRDVVRQCVNNVGAHEVDLLVQKYVVERECKKRGITASSSEVEGRLDRLRRSIAPATLDEACKMHNTTVPALKLDFAQDIERTKLVIDRVMPVKMVHCAAIIIKYCPPGTIPGVSSDIKHTQAQAENLIRNIQDQLRLGHDFGDLAAQYSDVGYPDDKGDLGIFYPGINDIDTAVLTAALGLNAGQTSPEYFATNDGAYCIVRAVSTSERHSASEDEAYAEAAGVYNDQQAQTLIPDYIVDLIKKSHVVYYVHS